MIVKENPDRKKNKQKKQAKFDAHKAYSEAKVERFVKIVND